VDSFWKRTSANVAAWTVAGFFFASQLYFLYPIASGREMSFGRALLVNLPALLGLAWGADTYAKYRDRELAASRLQTQLARAELSALKMQLQPHFLFNTLNAVAALLKANPDAAEGMILKLSDFLRLTLNNTGRPDVTLREELDFLERYLAIEKIRFQDRLLTRFRIRTEVLDARVPNLLLQPLVENAIRHGIARDRRAGRLEVSATHEKGRLLLRVTDDGPGAPPGRVLEGIGLTITRERLRHLYGDASSLEYGNAPGGGFCVSLSLPLVFLESERSSP